MRVILPFSPISFSFPHEEPIEPSAIIQAAVATGLHPSNWSPKQMVWAS